MLLKYEWWLVNNEVNKLVDLLLNTNSYELKIKSKLMCNIRCTTFNETH